MSTFAIICLLLSVIIYILYVSIIYVKYKPSCISESYYKIKYGWMFTVWTLLVSFLIFPAWVEISPICFQFLPFLSSISLGAVGLNPKYLESDRKVHVIAALLAGVISLIWNVVIGVYSIPVLLSIILIFGLIAKVPNPLFWIECTAFSNIYLSIFLS